MSNADFIVPVEIDGVVHQVYVLKRPFVDEFLQRMGELFECVLFTASLAKVSVVDVAWHRPGTDFHRNVAGNTCCGPGHTSAVRPLSNCIYRTL